MTNDNILQILVYGLVFVLIAGWEVLAPRRKLSVRKGFRWRTNIAMGILNQLLLRVLFPVLLVGFAAMTQARGWGLLNAVSWPGAVAFLLGFLLLELTIYWQHRLFHKLPWLWRLHRVHHTDLDFDLTTAVRFHPVEILLSMLIKMAVVVLVGPPLLAVLLFELLLSLNALFSHGNITIPVTVDRVLRWLIVTPDMHRVHHSTEEVETNSNFSFNLSCWDRLFGSYRDQPTAGHQAMHIGQDEFIDEEKLGFGSLLRQPLVSTK
jgi:sterol desaturase/sphingolipid hydroxylase (fatty acid hydroxylase superfamily)